MKKLLDLSGKTAVVTGATAGIGQTIAETLASAGAFVVCIGTNQERGALVVQSIVSNGGKATFFAIDVSDSSLVEAIFKEIVEQQGTIDILVNNAGITRDGLLARMKLEDWDQVLAVNLRSCFLTCKAAVRPMMKQRQGVMINISSVVGLTGNAGQVNYAASKSGMLGLTRSLAKEVASRNIRVNAIAPGYVETRMTDALDEQQKSAILEQIPLGRIGQPKEIANLVLFLASDLSSYITGQVIAADGGMVTS